MIGLLKRINRRRRAADLTVLPLDAIMAELRIRLRAKR